MFSANDMKQIPDPIFKNKLSKISWKKIYEREYGVQYSEVAISLFAFAKHHFPKLSFDQIVVPGQGANTAFFIDGISWIKLVEGLNKKYTADVKKLEEYEKQFLSDGKIYLDTAKKISKLDLKKLSNKELLSIFLEHQEKRFIYSSFAWTAFILNNYVADRAVAILDKYIEKDKGFEKQELHDSLFSPEKRAAILKLQYEVEKQAELTKKQMEELYVHYKWLSCLDIHNSPWTKEEFIGHTKSFIKSSDKQILPFKKIAEKLKISGKDLDYLLMAKRFVYIKDARDDFRRESVFYAGPLFAEIARRMKINSQDTSYLQTKEIEKFLKNNNGVDKSVIEQRKRKFVLYLDIDKNLVCLHGEAALKALKYFNLVSEEEKVKEITGRVASKGTACGKVVIIKGVKDLNKVEKGDILVAVTTHPDFVPAMRKAIAIVTDEGGITSHAAIVSREFEIPCIVGTKNATKHLKDGDEVEVDAINGLVRKI
ncbi:hypothetical protein C4559_04640 [Candidatus Microgenomates bacterium]|nr:MAG: hypothetical protein C4559_04640 [Candidatus Microgenomates bacterium]